MYNTRVASENNTTVPRRARVSGIIPSILFPPLKKVERGPRILSLRLFFQTRRELTQRVARPERPPHDAAAELELKRRTYGILTTLTSFTILAQAKYGPGGPARASPPRQGIEDGRNRCLDARQSDASGFVIRGFHSFSGTTRLSPKIPST